MTYIQLLMKNYSLLLAFFLFPCSLFAQSRRFLLVDEATHETIPYANCVVEGTKLYAISDAEGYVDIDAHDGTLIVTCMGYETLRFPLGSDSQTTISLRQSVKSLNEVTVSATVPQYVQTQMSKTTLPVGVIKGLPSMVGEPDIMKALTVLPGVAQTKDGYSNIVVRGADRGQSLLLMDGIRIYNYNHFGGLISFVNVDAVKNVDIYKADFPSRFGGMTSAVVDVVGKDGDKSARHVKASVGVTSSSLFSEGPLGDKVTYVVAARVNYQGVLNLFKSGRYDIGEYRAAKGSLASGDYYNMWFWDVNGRLRWQVVPSASLTLTVFSGNDMDDAKNFQAASDRKNLEEYVTRDGNTGVAVTFSKAFDRTVWRTTASLSDYATSEKYMTEDVDFRTDRTSNELTDIRSNIRDLCVTAIATSTLGRHSLNAGVEALNSWLRPAREHYKLSTVVGSYPYEPIRFENIDTVTGSSSSHSSELSAFVGDDIKFGNRGALSVGLRATRFTSASGNHNSIEPRLGYRHLVSDHSSLKLSFATMRQFTHSIVNSSEGFETEIRLTASGKLPPQESSQVAAGYYYADDDRKLNFSAEAYYKRMRHLLDYISYDPENRAGVAFFDSNIKSGGRGRSYGIELQVTKDFKRVSCGLSYTLSRSERKFAEIDGGRWFKANFDRTHDLAAHAATTFLQHWMVSALFSISTGVPCNVPIAMHEATSEIPGYYVYGKRNSSRVPTYHRLDIGVRRWHVARRGLRHEWSFNLNNAYAHANALSVYYKDGRLYQTSRLFMIPSLNYTVSL